MNKINTKIKIYFYIFFLFLFSILFNQHYGFIGINPIDSFFSFNSGYDILNGFYPFKDYWTITGPFTALTQSLFFKFFGVSWFSYVFHASTLNFFLSISTFFIFYKLKLKSEYCFFYALLVSVLAAPSAGTPYVDHQSAFLSIISLYLFILGIKTRSSIYWFFLPIMIVASFLTKQTPTGHIFIIIVALSLIYFVSDFNYKNFISGLLGSITIISIFFIVLFIGKISFVSFYEHYISFPMSLGKSRLEFLFPLEFKRIFLRFKLIHLVSIPLFIILIIQIKKSIKFFYKSDFIIIISLIITSYALIAHQLMTINGLYIFFIIPILAGFSQIFYFDYFKKSNYLLIFLLFISFSSTLYYGYKYIHQRDFMDLRNANFEKSIDSKIFDKSLKNLKWITPLEPKNPSREVKDLLEVIKIIDDDKRKKIIISDYQFISVILSTYDNSPSQVWFGYHVNPEKDSEHYDSYKKFFINKIKDRDAKVVYIVKPLWGGDDIFTRVLSKDCLKSEIKSEKLDSFILNMCTDLQN